MWFVQRLSSIESKAILVKGKQSTGTEHLINLSIFVSKAQIVPCATAYKEELGWAFFLAVSGISASS